MTYDLQSTQGNCSPELTGHQNMLGLSTSAAQEDVVKAHTKRFREKRNITPGP